MWIVHCFIWAEGLMGMFYWKIERNSSPGFLNRYIKAQSIKFWIFPIRWADLKSNFFVKKYFETLHVARVRDRYRITFYVGVIKKSFRSYSSLKEKTSYFGNFSQSLACIQLNTITTVVIMKASGGEWCYTYIVDVKYEVLL